MVKTTKRISIVAIVLLYQLSYTGVASAGFFDWLVSKEADLVLVNGLIENRLSYSEDFWGNIRARAEEQKNEFEVIKTYTVRATGYSSTPDQTDSTPFITASGTYVRDGIIAANVYENGRRLPFGTLVRIPEIYGDKIFVVEDRMNIRYKNNIDIWFPERSSALTFGSKKVTIEIVEES